MKAFLGRIRCYQCRRYFFASNLFCPCCGATRRETAGQTSVRWLRILVVSGILGAALGFASVVAARWMMTNPSALGNAPSPFPHGVWSMEIFASIVGCGAGVLISAMMTIARET